MKATTRIAVVLLAAAAVAAAGLYASKVLLESRPGAATPGACAAHGIVRCPFCDPSVVDTMGLCREHGVPEALCARCRGDLEPLFRARGDWCNEHGVPESQCEACNPGALERYRESESGGPAPPLDPLPDAVTVERDDTPRIRRSPSVTCATERSVVRFANPDVAARAGLQTAEVTRAPLRETISAPAELHYDATRHAVLASRAPGTVIEVRVQPGDHVATGDVILVVDSATLGTAKSELLQARARVELWQSNHRREAHLLENSLSTEKDVLEAANQLAESRIAVTAAEQKLRNLGLADDRIAAVLDSRDTSNHLELTAPFAGVVVDLRAVVGQLAAPATTLVEIADTSRLWVLADVPQRTISAVSAGQAVLLTLDGMPGQTLAGRVTWISTRVDPRTRTIKVRAELDNRGGELRAGMFGRARIVTRDGEPALLVPKAAVQWEGCCNVAFVQRSSTSFAPHKLLLGYDTGQHYEVLSGLAAGDRVVTQGSFLLKTELQKASIGAGCCEVDHLGK